MPTKVDGGGACEASAQPTRTVFAEVLLFHGGGWLIAELTQALWTPELARFATTSVAARQLVRGRWAQTLRTRGFSEWAVSRLSVAEAWSLERWGGQGWDAWRRQGKDPMTLLRHWEHGTVLVLRDFANGWFDFQARAGERPKTFYSTGTTEAMEWTGTGLAEDFGFKREVAEGRGRRPMFKLPNAFISCWRWTLDASSHEERPCAVIFYHLPGVFRGGFPEGFRRRLRLTATGFAAFGDGDGDINTPTVVVERGVQLTARN